MTKSLFVIVSLALFSVLSAYSTVRADEVHDIVILTNGSLVEGTIIEKVDGKYIVVRTLDGHNVKIPVKRIASITRNDTDYKAAQKQILDSVKSAQGEPLEVKRYLLHIQSPMNLSEKSTTAGISGMLEYMTNRKFSIGLGLGIDWSKNGHLIPVMNQLTYYFGRRNWKPYAFGRAGFAIGLREDFNSGDAGGFRFALGTGLQIKLSPKTSATIEMGYTHQSLAKEVAALRKYSDWFLTAIGIKF